MAKNEKKSWCVFNTKWGHLVSQKKITEKEACEIMDSVHLEIKSDILGVYGGENFVSDYVLCSQWKLSDAIEYAKRADADSCEEYKSAIKRYCEGD